MDRIKSICIEEELCQSHDGSLEQILKQMLSIYKEPKSICHNMLIDLRLLAMTKLSLTYQILTLLIGGSFFVEMSVGSDTNHGQYQDFDA